MLYMAFECRGGLCCNEQEKPAGGRGKKKTTTIQKQNMSTFRNTHGHFWQTSKDNHEKTIMWKERTQTRKHTLLHTNSTLKSNLQVYSMSVFTRLHQTALSLQHEELGGGQTAPLDQMTPTLQPYVCVQMYTHVYKCVKVCVCVCVCVYLTVNRDGLWPRLDVWERGEGGSWVDCFFFPFFSNQHY